jgi:phage gp16-like protein
MPRDPALAKIHIARKELRLSDEDYRAILHRVAGVESSSKLSPPAVLQVLAEFERLGWRPSFSGQRRRSDKPGVRLVFGLWRELAERKLVENPSRRALLAFVERQTGIADPEWLTQAQINKVVEGLKAMLARGRDR